jgi:glycosyltransferase involved in cell wall biosynthesis
MIAYIFPPLGGSGVYRTLKFAKYLPESGWAPVIVSSQDPDWYHLLETDQFEREIGPNTEVYRVRPWPVLKTLRKAWRFFKGSVVSQEDERSKPPAISRVKGNVRRILSIPDEQVWWLFPAFFAGWRLLRKDRGPRVIYSTSGPYTDHLVGLLLKLVSGKPWIADFRDLWSDNLTLFPTETGMQRINAWLERVVVRFADKVLTTAEPATEYFREKYANQDVSKFVTITNGFDSADLKDAEPRKFEKFTVSWVGELYASQSPEPALKGFAESLKLIPRDEIALCFVGAKERKYVNMLQEFTAREGLDGVVESKEQVSHQEAIAWMLGSDALLLIMSEEANQNGRMYTGKLFEYLAARRPIIAIAPPGATSRVISELGVGTVCGLDDIECIKKAFVDAYAAYRDKKAPNSSVDISRFDRRFLTKMLADVFDSLAAG